MCVGDAQRCVDSKVPQQGPQGSSGTAHGAHRGPETHFLPNTGGIESWFNVISPESPPPSELKRRLALLQNKEWGQ